MSKLDIKLVSKNRYNGGVRIKRLYGGSTVTEFYVTINGINQSFTATGFGKTPGERKTYAKNMIIKLVEDNKLEVK